MSTVPLLTTKLYIPPPRPNLVPRPRLLERLDQGAAHETAADPCLNSGRIWQDYIILEERGAMPAGRAEVRPRLGYSDLSDS